MNVCFLQGLQKGKTYVCVVSAECVKGECTIGRVALVMSIVPCRGLDLNCSTLEKTSTCLDPAMSWFSNDKQITTLETQEQHH